VSKIQSLAQAKPCVSKALELAPLVADWKRHLKAKNLAPSSILSYVSVADKFSEYQQTVPNLPLVHQIEAYLATVLQRTSAANSRKHHRNLQQFFRWLTDEGELDANPMLKIRPPKVPEKLVAVFSDLELSRLLSACKGNSFLQRRNAALIRVLMDTGIRAAELCRMQLGDVDLDVGLITVTGKGRRPRVVPTSAKTSESISRYLRQRNRHTNAALSSLWLSNKGELTTSGLGQIVDRIGLRANVKDVYPHRFRHTAAHQWLSAGGGERSLMRIMGWRSPAMLSRYGASAADERARDEFRKLNLGDRL
jgi:site-specific recombinase XerD